MTADTAARDVNVAELHQENADLRRRNLEVAMLAHKWMVAHDMLKAGEPYQTPAVADVPESKMRAEMAEANLAHYVSECKGLRRQVEYTEERRQYWHHEACKENTRADTLAAQLAETEKRNAVLVEEAPPPTTRKKLDAEATPSV